MRTFEGVSLIALAMFIASPAVAHAENGAADQSSPRDPGAAEAQADAGEIVVTANKREQKLNEIGATVAVVSGDALKARQITSLADLAQAVPGLSFTNSAGNTPVFTLRGIGFYETSLSAYPAVSVYVDEVALPFPALTAHSAYDLQRVEVLKGPQGTLFGQNATGGALNYIAAKPTSDFSAGANLSYGRFNEIVGDGYVSGPLAEGLTARLSAHVEHVDGWQQSLSRRGDTNGRVRNYAGRLQVAWEPSSSARLLLGLNGWIDKSETQAPQYTGIQPQSPILSAALANSPFSPETPRATDWTPGVPHADNRFAQASLRGDFDVADGIVLTSLTAYVHYRQRQGEEADGLPISTLDIRTDDGTIESFSQELRLSNGGDGRARWVVGGNYEHSSVDQQILTDITSSTANTTLAAVLGYPISFPFSTASQKMTNYAFFGNLEYDLTPSLAVKAGGRYTRAKNSVTSCNETNSGLPGDAGPFFFDILLGGAFGPYTNGTCFAINDLGVTNGTVAPGAPGAYTGKLDQDNFSWRVGLDWKVRPGLLAYANVARGYKAGAFPTVSASTFVQYLPVTQESVLSYEVGFKASLFDKVLQLNGAAFYYDYTDKQLRTKINAPPFGILDVLGNVPKSKVKGFEIELDARPVAGLSISGAFTYLDAKVTRFTGFNTVGALTDFANSRVPFTPKYQLGANVDYEFPLAGQWNGFIGTSVNYRSDTVALLGGDINPPNASPQTKKLFGIGAYTLVDLRAGIRMPGNKVQFSVWGKNVFNEYYWNNVTAGDAISRYVGKPATYGISVGYKF